MIERLDGGVEALPQLSRPPSAGAGAKLIRRLRSLGSGNRAPRSGQVDLVCQTPAPDPPAAQSHGSAVLEPHPRKPDFVTSAKFTAIRNELYALLHDEIRKTVAETSVSAAAGPPP